MSTSGREYVKGSIFVSGSAERPKWQIIEIHLFPHTCLLPNTLLAFSFHAYFDGVGFTSPWSESSGSGTPAGREVCLSCAQVLTHCSLTLTSQQGTRNSFYNSSGLLGYHQGDRRLIRCETGHVSGSRSSEAQEHKCICSASKTIIAEIQKTTQVNHPLSQILKGML